MRLFWKCKRFEVFMEYEKHQILDRFFDHRHDDGNHEWWFGRFYLTLFIAKT